MFIKLVLSPLHVMFLKFVVSELVIEGQNHILAPSEIGASTTLDFFFYYSLEFG